ncbi:MAG: hypothetical protein ABIN91_06220 [Mucilaginibacter sp.]
MLALFTILVIPVILGYSYNDDTNNAKFLYIASSCGYALIFKRRQLNFASCLTASAICFALFGFIAFMGVMFGSVVVKDKWNINDYQIKYIEERGFSGGPLMRYELNKYTKYSILIKNVDNKIDTDSVKTCTIKFEEVGLTFDKCQPDSLYLTVKK